MTKLHPLIAEMANEDRAHDPWGTGMMVLGAVCDTLTREGQRSVIPASAGYSPGLFTLPEAPPTDSYHEWTLHQAMHPDEFPDAFVPDMEPLTVDDLAYAARVLDRYLDLVRLAGRDY